MRTFFRYKILIFAIFLVVAADFGLLFKLIENDLFRFFYLKISMTDLKVPITQDDKDWLFETPSLFKHLQ